MVPLEPIRVGSKSLAPKKKVPPYTYYQPFRPFASFSFLLTIHFPDNEVALQNQNHKSTHIQSTDNTVDSNMLQAIAVL